MRRRGFQLTKEKKALLKKIIMEKVKEEMYKEAIQKKEQKDKKIGEIVPDLPAAISDMTKGMIFVAVT